MASNTLRDTPQPQACRAVSGCADQIAAGACLEPAIPPRSELLESIWKVADSDQTVTRVLGQDHDDQFKGGKVCKRERMVVSEQLRRKRMKELCSDLESLLPSTTLPKLDRCGLFEEASNYIRKLQNRVEELKRRREIYLQGKQVRRDDKSLAEESEGLDDSVEVVVKVYDREAVVTIRSPRRPRCHWRIVEEVEGHGLDVNMSHFFAGDFIVFLCFQANVRTQPYNSMEMQTALESRLKMVY